MTTPRPEALTPVERADMLATLVVGAQSYRGRLSKVTTGDWQVILATLDAERAARQTPDTSGLLDRIRRETREAVQEGDRQDCSSPDCIADAVYEIVRAALAATATPPADAPLDCTCDPVHQWPCAVVERCDEPECDREATCGWPTRPGGTGPNGGYRRTCGNHMRAARLTDG